MGVTPRQARRVDARANPTPVLRYDSGVAPLARAHNPHVERRPGVCGGVPVVRGTRFPVRSVVEYVLCQGMTPEEMVREWKCLTLAQIHGALAFYYDHRREIDADMRRNRRLFGRAKGPS